jgi:hypothetical protein
LPPTPTHPRTHTNKKKQKKKKKKKKKKQQQQQHSGSEEDLEDMVHTLRASRQAADRIAMELAVLRGAASSSSGMSGRTLDAAELREHHGQQIEQQTFQSDIQPQHHHQQQQQQQQQQQLSKRRKGNPKKIAGAEVPPDFVLGMDTLDEADPFMTRVLHDGEVQHRFISMCVDGLVDIDPHSADREHQLTSIHSRIQSRVDELGGGEDGSGLDMSFAGNTFAATSARSIAEDHQQQEQHQHQQHQQHHQQQQQQQQQRDDAGLSHRPSWADLPDRLVPVAKAHDGRGGGASNSEERDINTLDCDVKQLYKRLSNTSLQLLLDGLNFDEFLAARRMQVPM